MKLLAILGTKNSGKTTVAEFIIRGLSEDGYNVAAVKHIHHEFTMDTSGKDTWRFGRAGARLVISVSPREIAAIRKTDGNVSFDDLLNLVRQAGVTDVLVFEGFSQQLGGMKRVPKIVTAKNETELHSFLQNLAGPIIAVSGAVAASANNGPKLKMPVIDVTRKGDELLNLVKEEVGLPSGKRTSPTKVKVR